jgi:hypothetical protein
MKTKPMLGEFALDGIEYIESSESRALAEHRVPGLAGNYFQDMGAVANTIVIAGTKSGDEARDEFLNGIRGIFNKGEQTTFVADINTATDITDVIIEDLDVAEIGGSAHSFRYQLTLRKYTKPPEPPQTSLLDTGILGDALNVLDALNALDALSSIPNLGDPTGPIRGALDNLKGTTSGLDQAVGSVRNLLAQDVPAPGAAGGPGDAPRADGSSGTEATPGSTSESGASAPQEGSGATPEGGDSNAAPSATAPDQSGSASTSPTASDQSGATAPSSQNETPPASGGPGITPEQFARLELTDESPAGSQPASTAGAPAPGTVRALAPDNGGTSGPAAGPAAVEGAQDETAPADVQGAESHRCEPGVPIEVGFVHFNNDRHVLMPEGPSPDPPGSETPGGSLDGLQVVANALDHARKHPKRQMLVTGHSDSTALISYNLPLSARRADSTFCVLQGYDLKDLWVQSALRDGGHADDWRRILRWVDKTFKLDCEASDPNKPDFAKDQKAITNFQKGYNNEVDRLAANNIFAPGFAQKIPGSQLGFVGIATWQAFFDFYQRDLVRQLSLTTQAELTTVQKNVSLINLPTQGCSEFHSRDLAERAARRTAGYPEKAGPKDPRDRRVEILFFDPGEAPPFECHPTTDVNRCEPSKCVLYANQQFPQRPLPVIGAAPATTVKLERIDVLLRTGNDFEEGRRFTPLVREKIRFRVSVAGLSTPFDGKVRVTVSRDTTDGLTAVAAVDVRFCADEPNVTVDVIWEGVVDRAVPRQVSTRTTPDLNPGAKPTNIPLREMDQDDIVRHGVYVAGKIEVLEKDDSVLTSVDVSAKDGAFVVAVACTLFFEPRLFATSLGNFGIGDGSTNDAPYLDSIRRAIFITAVSHYDGIGVRFFRSSTRAAARGLMVEIRDVVAALDGSGGGVIPGGAALLETGDKFMVRSNIFGWADNTFIAQANGDHFEIQVGPDGLLNRNADQKSDDSIVLNEVFGPLGVARDSMHEPFFEPAQTPKPVRPRTVTNGKVDGRITAVDVTNTTITVSDAGVIEVTTRDPALVPTQRATEITRALNALANSTGIFVAHELGHGLGLIAQTSAQKATIEVVGKGTFLSPLAGIAESHSATALGQLMDKGEDIRWRTIFTPGKRLPLGASNKRYLTDCFPEKP